jgi:hypothetical protein
MDRDEIFAEDMAAEAFEDRVEDDLDPRPFHADDDEAAALAAEALEAAAYYEDQQASWMDYETSPYEGTYSEM